MEKDFFEECWFLYGFKVRSFYFGFLKYHSKGSYAEVKWDWKQALMPFLIGWYHSHPGKKFLTPSSTDDKTMRSWVKGFSKSYLCGIYCGEEQRCYLYYKGPESTTKNTVVRKMGVAAKVQGPLFIGRIKEDAISSVA